MGVTVVDLNRAQTTLPILSHTYLTYNPLNEKRDCPLKNLFIIGKHLFCRGHCLFIQGVCRFSSLKQLYHWNNSFLLRTIPFLVRGLVGFLALSLAIHLLNLFSFDPLKHTPNSLSFFEAFLRGFYPFLKTFLRVPILFTKGEL